MVATLKSISKPIPWSLVVKSIVLGGVWYFLPLPFFLVLAVFFYFVPLFRPLELGAPFLVTLVLSFSLKAGFWTAIFIVAAMYLILGTKDLILMNRKAIYETLVFVLIFVLFMNFFLNFGTWFGISSILWSVAIGFFTFFLFKGFVNYDGVLGEELGLEAGRHKFLVVGLSSFFIWQVLWVLVFLPVGSIYQTAILFLVSVILLEFVLAYFSRTLTPRRVLVNFTMFFVFLVFILTSTRWEL